MRVLQLFRQKPKPKILVLVDFPNLLLNMAEIPSFREMATRDALQNLISKIARETKGEVVGTFVFVPPEMANVFGEIFYATGFFIVFCPKIRDKERILKDTTDEHLITLGETLLEHVSDLTHLCLGSGDQDFMPLVRKALNKGLQIIIVAGSEKSLSRELKRLADKIHILSLKKQ